MTGCYKLQCWGCQKTVQLPAVEGAQPCPLCGATLCIQWNAARAEFDRAQRELRK
jgi:rRNA maturation endonuclease Nob1